MEFNEQEHAMDILSREWINDFSSLSQKDINNLILNMFYQLFMIDLDSIEIYSSYDRSGNRVKFILEGEAFRDGDTLKNNIEITEEDE